MTAQDRNCQALTQAFLKHKGQFQFEKIFTELTMEAKPFDQNNLLQLLETEKEARINLKKEFEEKAKDLLTKWYQTRNKPFLSGLVFDEYGRVTVNCGMFEDNTFFVGQYYTYFPSQFREINGSLFLTRDISEARGLNTVRADLFIDAEDFTAENLEYVNGRISSEGKSVRFPKLIIVNGTLEGHSVENADLASLKRVDKVELLVLTHLSTPNLEYCKELIVPTARTVEMPKLYQGIPDLDLRSATKIKAEKLENALSIRIDSLPDEIGLLDAFPSLKEVNLHPVTDKAFVVGTEKRRQEILRLKAQGLLDFEGPIIIEPNSDI